MPKPPSHPRYQAVARSEPYPSSANRSGGGHNNHGGGHGHSGRHGSTGMMYHHAAGSMNTTAGVRPGVPPPAHPQSAAPPNYGYGGNPGIGAGSRPGTGTGMMNPQYATATITSTPRTIPRNFGGQQSSPSSSTSTYGQQPSFESLQGPNQPHNSSPSSAPNFQLTGYQHQDHALQQQHAQHQQHHQGPTIVNQNAAHPTHFPPQPQPHQPPNNHHQPPQTQVAHPTQSPIPNPSSSYNPRPTPPSPSLHNPTTSWTPREDALLLSSRASQLPWSELQRLHFPGKTANACRKRHERLIEKRQAEEEVDEDRLARIAGEYVKMRGELWQGLAERIGMDVKEVEERCLGMGVGRLKVAGRRGGRRRASYPVVATGMAGMGPVSTVMPMMFSQGQGQGQGQGDAEEGRNYTHSPVQIGSTGAGQSMIGPGLGAGPGMAGPGHGMGMGMLPPQTAPPLTTLVPIPPPTTTGHGYNVNTSALPTSSAPGIPPPPLLPLMQQQQQQQQQPPRVAFGGYLNGRSSSRRPTHPLPYSSAPPSATASAPVNVNANTNPSGGFDQGQGQGQVQQWPRRQGGVNPAGSVGMGMGMTVPDALTTGPPTSQTWHSGGGGGGGGGGGYPPSSFG
ncbi:uncharacterized protein B0T23DRAFT_441198 [Neurospora hispaniola]|uniref:Myb-like domain-containing protein n=1 Tax=Neurospora hispaniola TaxID=588809 RepID=A0AAJ0MT32_9PEZI|nr:hypothetical protein B0T23DRAFT_441198 [Neurospora hispaniola]